MSLGTPAFPLLPTCSKQDDLSQPLCLFVFRVFQDVSHFSPVGLSMAMVVVVVAGELC